MKRCFDIFFKDMASVEHVDRNVLMMMKQKAVLLIVAFQHWHSHLLTE